MYNIINRHILIFLYGIYYYTQCINFCCGVICVSNSTDKSLRQMKEEKTRSEILSSAEKLYNERGINNISVNEIANEALVSRVTVYNYFGSSDGVKYALIRQRMKEGNLGLKQLTQMNIPSQEKLNKIIEISFDASITSPARYGILRQFLVQDNARDQILEERYKDILDKRTQKFKIPKDLPLDEQYLLELQEELWTYEKTLVDMIIQCQEENIINKGQRAIEFVYFIVMSLQGITDQIATNTTPLRKFNIPVEKLRRMYLDAVHQVLYKV